MSAKEMFEELGYKIVQNDMNWLRYGINTSKWYACFIDFNLREKKIEISNKVDTFGKTIELDELQAINKQVEELGWK